ncbi:hypothetical protein [Litoribacter populi]|uniref:hypothetical protein n=1 Tax=Litoribacter populi TaxID=2598460 RepID=UPI00117DC051|nr:hypothetical protein [Litoribacter populi]
MNVINYNYGKYSRAICGTDFTTTKTQNNLHHILRRKNPIGPLETIRNFFTNSHTLPESRLFLETIVANIFSHTPDWKKEEKAQMHAFLQEFRKLLEAAYQLSENHKETLGTVKNITKQNLIPAQELVQNAKLDQVYKFFPRTLDHAEILVPHDTIRNITKLIELDALKAALTEWELESISARSTSTSPVVGSLFFVHIVLHCFLEACHLIYVRELAHELSATTNSVSESSKGE